MRHKSHAAITRSTRGLNGYVGAYLKYFEQCERDGTLRFVDPKVAENFWYYFRMEHRSPYGDQDPFARPWWITASDGGR